MLGNFINILREYSAKNLAHGDFQPSYVFVFDENGKRSLIIIDSAFMNEFETGYLRMLNDHDYKSPLSRNALGCLMRREHHEDFDKGKNDIWGAGVTL